MTVKSIEGGDRPFVSTTFRLPMPDVYEGEEVKPELKDDWTTLHVTDIYSHTDSNDNIESSTDGDDLVITSKKSGSSEIVIMMNGDNKHELHISVIVGSYGEISVTRMWVEKYWYKGNFKMDWVQIISWFNGLDREKREFNQNTWNPEIYDPEYAYINSDAVSYISVGTQKVLSCTTEKVDYYPYGYFTFSTTKGVSGETRIDFVMEFEQNDFIHQVYMHIETEVNEYGAFDLSYLKLHFDRLESTNYQPF